jgi:hypothetical protein
MLVFEKKEIELVYRFYKVLVLDVNGANEVNPCSVKSNKVLALNCKEVMLNICWRMQVYQRYYQMK